MTTPYARIGALVVAIALATRLHQVLVPLGDSSMGLYVHVAREWLAGHAPYTLTWEFKPPGLFAIYALALALVPQAPLALQLLGALCTIATAFALWEIAKLLDPIDGEATGAYAAMFAAMLAIEDEAFLTDAEVLIAPLVAWAFVLALRRPRTFAAGGAIGALLGLALQCKLSAIALVLPVLALLSLEARTAIPTLAGAGAGIVLPFALDTIGYAAIGRLSDLISANTGAVAARAAGLRAGVLRENLPIFGEHLRIFAPAIELGCFAPGRGFTARAALVAFGWLSCGLLSIVAIGEFYDRQFTLLYAPIALLGAFGLRRCVRFLRERGRPTAAAVALVFAIAFALHDYYEVLQGARAALAAAGAVPAHVTDRLPLVTRGIACLHRPGETAYLVSITPFAYDDAHLRSPTRFPFTDHLFDDRMGVMIGVDPAAELRRIFDARPQLVVTDDDYRSNGRYNAARVRFVDARLARDYVRVASAPHLAFYERREPGAAVALARTCPAELRTAGLR